MKTHQASSPSQHTPRNGDGRYGVRFAHRVLFKHTHDPTVDGPDPHGQLLKLSDTQMPGLVFIQQASLTPNLFFKNSPPPSLGYTVG